MGAEVKINWDKTALEKVKVPAYRALVKCGLQMEADIKKSFTSGGGRSTKRQTTATGAGYLRKGGKMHIASAPGEAPAVDTGRLRASITTNWSDSGKIALEMSVVPASIVADGVKEPSSDKGQFTVVVGTNVEYAPWLEFGTSKMLARPYLIPAYERARARIMSIMRRESTASGLLSDEQLMSGGVQGGSQE